MTDERGLARSGLILRHLIMPGAVEESQRILTRAREQGDPTST